MAEKLTTYVWRHSARDQMLLLATALVSFPIIWITLELPKTIINDAIGGAGFPRTILGYELEQTQYLLALCLAYLAAISVNNAIKYVQNMQRGILGERMLRRMRFDLFRRVMGRPLGRLRDTSPGEIVQMISAELEQLGDFIGAIVVTPVMAGGSFLVYLGFIIAQNAYIGVAALALYPLQAWLIPKLQAKVVAMIRLRLINIRAMAREIDESIDGAVEVRALRARRWHMAIVSGQLYDNYVIRRRIFILKFLIKFVNNVANHVTPFFIFLIGGWFVIQGDLDIGALTAVLIAYKDLAAPWKELLRFYQDFSDRSARFASVMENFDEDGEPAPLRETAPVGPHAVELRGASVPELSGSVSCHAAKGAEAAILGDDTTQRAALAQALAGLADGLEENWRAGMPILYRAAVYVPADPRAFTGTLRSNLLQGIQFRPVAEADDAAARKRKREADLTGAPHDDVDDDWIDPEEAGHPDHDAVEARMLELAAALGFEEDLYSIGLGSRLDPAKEPELARRLLELRKRIAASGELGEMREDFIDVWQEDAFNPNGTVGENLFFGLPSDPKRGWADLVADRDVRRALSDAGVHDMLVILGVDICEALISLFEGVGPESDLFKRYGMFPRAETPAIEVIVRRARQRGPGRLNRSEQIRMLAIAMDYGAARFRLGVLRGEGREAELVKARPQLRAALAGDPRIVFFDPEEYVPAFSIAQNVFFGPVRVDRRDSWGPFKARVDALVEEIDLRPAILRAGLDQRVGEGGAALNAAQRRKLGLARALMKNPGALLLDGIAAGAGEADLALRALLRRELGPEAALVWTTSSAEAAAAADHVIRIDRAGRVNEGPPERGGDEGAPGRAGDEGAPGRAGEAGAPGDERTRTAREGPVDGGSNEGR